MLSENAIKEFAVKYQTSELNIAREYFQNLFLSVLYLQKNAEDLAFKGGTALRIVFNSPRFSEDLDFTADTGLKAFSIKQLLSSVLKEVEKENMPVKTLEAKETSGGFLAICEIVLLSYKARLELNISTRPKNTIFKMEPHLIASELFPPYTLLALDSRTLVKEKLQALLFRKKPRDLFDLYYIIRSRIAPEQVVALKKEILKMLEEYKEGALTGELKVFLPKSYWSLLPGMIKKLKEQVKSI
ncbi:MAG: nucleotidyl transferase AbiEii/AbiGii toxin family protein [Candidatus Firestonebacteria bacterium]